MAKRPKQLKLSKDERCSWCHEFRGLKLGKDGRNFYCWRHLKLSGGPYDGESH